MNCMFSRKAGLLSFMLLLTGLLASLLVAASASADELYARVRGTVKDPSGAVVPGVELKITNPSTGVAKQTTSDSDGTFELINLPPGTYTLTATKAGFAATTFPELTLQANQVYVRTISLELGAVTEVIAVTASPVQVEQTSIQLGATITAADLGTMPILNRNWIDLQRTLPGVYQADRFSNTFSTNGSQSQQNSYLVNGTDSNDLPLNSPLILPSPDAIAEVRMITNTINPEYGRNSGAIMNAISKSGTNNFHGSAFESYRDTSFNVHDFFHTNPTIFHQHIYGGTVGGPIIKNKTFFFFSLQNTRNRRFSTESVDSAQGSASPGVTTVFNPTTLAYGGSGSAPLSAFATLGKCAGTGACLSGNATPFSMTGSNGTVYPAGTPWQTVFAGGTIPTSDYNALSLKLIKQFVPQPNFSNNQFSFNPVHAVKDNQYLGRFDQNFGSKDSLWFFALGENLSATDDIPFFGSTLPGFGEIQTQAQKQFTLGWNHTFSSTLLNEFRLGYTRLNFVTVVPQTVVQPNSLGFTNIHPQDTVEAGVPLITVTGYFSFGFSPDGPQPRKDQTYQVTDNFSWVKGRHALKFGYEGRRFQVWNPFDAKNNGNFTFSSGGTYSTGDPGLDFLLGIPASYLQGSGAIIISQTYEHYFYAQDQWQLKPNLTLTLGTGYQIDPPIQEYQFGGIGRACFIMGQQSKVFASAPVGYDFPGDPGCNKGGGATTKYTHFGPRVGFAYSPDMGRLSGGPGKLSIRGGFGIYYNRSAEEENLQDLGVPPFGLTSTGVSDIGLDPGWPDPWSDVAGGGTLTNKFPSPAPKPGTPVDFTFFEPFSGLNVSAPDRTVPYAMNYNLTLERQLPGQTILRIAYVGAQGRKLIVSRAFNFATPAGVAACLASASCKKSPSLAYSSAVMSLPGNYLLPPTVWGNPGIEYNGGESNFSSLQITVEKHLTHGLTLHSTYAWAHSLDNTSSFEDTSFLTTGGVDTYGNLRRDYGDSAFDVRHRFVASFSYAIPNLNKISAFSRIPSRVFGGWRISGINTVQTGFPIQFQDSRNRSLTCSFFVSFYSCPDRPDLVTPPVALDPHTATFNGKTNYFFDPADFANNALGTEGNAGRGRLHGPNFWDLDSSLQKETKITERMSLTLGASAFNFLNHTNFGQPSGEFASSRFGRVTSIARFSNPRLLQLDARFTF